MISRLKHCAGFLRENRIDVKELLFPAKKFVFKTVSVPPIRQLGGENLEISRIIGLNLYLSCSSISSTLPVLRFSIKK